MIDWIKSRLTPTPPPYDPFEWLQLPLSERAKLSCHAWALQGFGAPLSVYLFYLIKIIVYVAVWITFCSLSPVLGGLTEISSWWSHPIAFQKAIIWSMLFEILGLGCGSGPLAARYFPPFGGCLYSFASCGGALTQALLEYRRDKLAWTKATITSARLSNTMASMGLY